MTYPLLKIVDDDLGVLFDLNDITGAANPYNFETILDPAQFDLGIATPTSSLFKPFGNARASVIGRDLGVAEMSFVVWCRSSDYRSGLRELQYLLSAGGTLLWQPSAAEEAALIEFLDASQLPNAYQSSAGVRAVVADGDDRGLEIGLIRQGLIRNATEVSSATNLLTNPTLLFDTVRSGTPTGWAWLSATNISAQAVDLDLAAFGFNIATTSARSLQQQSAVGSFAPGDVATFHFLVRAPVAGIVRARAALQFYQSNGTSAVGSEHVGTLTDIGNGWSLVSVTTSAAGALTSRATVSLRFENAAATDTTVKVRNAQLELGASPSTFVVSEQTISNQLDRSPIAVDDYNRATSNAWGVADMGGTWVLTGTAADFDTVTSGTGTGTIVSTVANTEHIATLPISIADVDVSAMFRTDKLAVGGNQEAYVLARGSGVTFYRAVAELRTSGDIFLRIDKVIAGTPTIIGTAVDTGLSVALTNFGVRLELAGRRIRARVWDAFPESDTWALSIEDTSITAAGFVGLGTVLKTGASNAPVTHSITDFVAAGLAQGRHAYIYVGGSAPTEVSLDFELGSGSQAQALNVASRPGALGRRVIPLANLDPSVSGGSRTIDRFVDDESSDGVVARITAGPGQPQRFARLEITDDLDAFKGTHDVYLRVKNGIAAGSADFRLGYGPSLADPTPYVGSKVTHDSDPHSAATPATSWVEIPVGRMHIRDDIDLAGVAIELYCSDTHADFTYVDCLILVPSEISSSIEIPYVARRALSLTDVIMDSGADTDTYALGVLAAGRYKITWYYSAENTSTEVVRFSIVNSATPPSQDPTVGDRMQQGFALEFDADGTTSYSLLAEYATFSGTPVYTVHARWLERVPYAQATEHIVTDPQEYRIEKVDTTGNVLIEASLGSGSIPLVLEPGLHSLYVSMLRPRHLGFYRELKPVLTDSVNLSYSYSVHHRQ